MKAPNDINDPIKPAMSVDIGPSSSGLFLDISKGNAGENHPVFKPSAKNIMQAKKKIWIYL